MNRPGVVKQRVVKQSCPDCAAAQIMPWRVYRKDCPECDIRCIANMRPQERDPIYERFLRECGRKAMLTVKERVGLEIVRLRLMREARAKP